ncbi:MAG: PAS domain S-box protein [Longimicrobiales bacterium]
MSVLSSWRRLLGPPRDRTHDSAKLGVSTAPHRATEWPDSDAARDDPGPDPPGAAAALEGLRALFQKHPVPTAILGSECRLLSANTALCSLLGYSELELQQRTLGELLRQPDPGPTDARAAVAEEVELRARSGERIWTKLTLVDVSGPGHYRLVVLENSAERRGLEDALMRAREVCARVVEANTNAIVVMDGPGTIILANHVAAAVTGYSVDELLGMDYRKILAEAEHAPATERMQAALTGGEFVSQFETKVLRKDGTTRTISVNLRPVTLENGQAGVVSTAEDVTTQRSAEQALRMSEDRYRDLVEQSGLMIGTHDWSGRLLSVNRSFIRFTGHERAEELIGTPVSELLAPSVRHLFPAYLEKIGAHGQAHGLMKVVTRNGDVRILEYSNSVRQEGLTEPIVRCFGQDVTERLRATRSLRDSEARYRALYEDNPAMYFTVDADGIILSVNRFGAMQLGYEPVELVGQSVLSVFLEADRAEVAEQMAMCLDHPGDLADWEFRKVRRDGSILWVREAVRAVPNAQGRIEVLIVCEDITERRRTEQALRDNDARLRALSDHLPNGAVYQLIRDGGERVNFSYMSAGIQQLLGVSAEDAMLDARAVFDLTVAEDAPRMQTAIDQSMRSLGVLDISIRMRAPDLVRWVHYRAAPRRLADGGTLWDGVLVDVTDARRNLEALLQTVDAIVWEAEGEVSADAVAETFVSNQAERLLGHPIRDWLDQPTFWLDHLHPEDRSRVVATRRQAIAAGEDYEIDYRMLAQDGRTVWLRDIVSIAARDEQRVRLRGIMVDVTEAKHAETALRESEERFRMLAEAMPAALLIYRGERWVYANPAAVTITGYTRDELLAMKIWELVPPQWRPIAQERAQMRQRGEQLPPRGELRLLTREGREHWIEIIATPIIFQGVPSVLVTGFDITERVRAEAALRESKEALRLSHERSRELAGKLMLTQEEERRRISRELHDDLNQKVAALSIMFSRLRHDLPESMDVVRDQLFELQVRMMGLSEDVRQLSHQLHPAALEHSGLVPALRSHCAEFSAHEGIAVDLNIRDCAETIPPQMALCLYRVTQESLRNIAKHAGTREARVTLSCFDDGVALSIADAGVGFDPEEVRRKGGLGLVSMEERIRLLHGSMQIRSEPEAGTELRVHLPWSDA